MTVRTRYAPSPTGHLHIGGARTALFSYLYAKKNDGKFVVRVEDTDLERNVKGADKMQMDMLKWLCVNWDESVDVGGPYGPYYSMERLNIYKEYVDKLLSEGKAYYSYASKEEIDRERAEQIERGVPPKYSGWDRNLSDDQKTSFEKEGRIPSVRLKVDNSITISWEDGVRGDISFDPEGIGDFVILREDGRPTYNFAVVIDDYLMKITHVLRGEEHISNTPRQLLLYRALGFEVPRFAHIPLILNKEGKKMSKRDESIVQFIDQYKDLGYLPEAIVNFLALLGWSPEGEEEIYSIDELTNIFSIERVSKAPAIFDMDKLRWMNNYYIKRLPLDEITEMCIPYLRNAKYIEDVLTSEAKEFVKGVVSLYYEQLYSLSDITELSGMFFKEEIPWSNEANEVLESDDSHRLLKVFLKQIEELDVLTTDSLKAAIKAVQKETGLKGKQLFMPIRAAITGVTSGPDLKESLALLGRDKVLGRIKQCISSR